MSSCTDFSSLYFCDHPFLRLPLSFNRAIRMFLLLLILVMQPGFLVNALSYDQLPSSRDRNEFEIVLKEKKREETNLASRDDLISLSSVNCCHRLPLDFEKVSAIFVQRRRSYMKVIQIFKGEQTGSPNSK